MKRRWLGVLLLLWASVSSLFAFTPGTALAAGPNCKLASATTITCTNTGILTGNLTLPWNDQNSSYFTSAGGFCDAKDAQVRTPNVVLNSKNSNGSYSATFHDGCGGSTTITVANPNNVTPKGDPGGGGGGNNNGGGNGTDPTTLCDSGTLTWLNCAIMSAAIDVIDGIRDYIIAPFLHVQPLTTTVKDSQNKSITNPVYTIWQSMRNVAAVFLILIFFFIIFGTALGLDNYTVKKTLPHLVAGAVLMPLSWYICAAMIDIGNVLGQGILTLLDHVIPKPFVDFTYPLSTIFYGIAGTVAVIALKGAVSEIGMALLITILIAILATFFTLVLRQILIILLVVLSPFAIMLWILPNTQKWFTQWWQNLVKLILMYPLIMLLFEAGRIFALTAGAGFTGGGAANDFEKAAVPILALAGLYLPLGAVPWTFSWAGGAMKMGAGAVGKIGGAANKRWGKGSQFDKDRSERRKERASASYTGHPVTKLGRALQYKAIRDDQGNITGYEERGRLAKMARNAAATRGGFGGAFPGQGPGKVAKRQMVGIAQKARQDEVVAQSSARELAHDLESGQYKTHDQIVDESVREHMAASRDSAKRALSATFKRAALTSTQLETLASGHPDGVTIDDVHYSGQHDDRIRETAVNELAQQEQWDSIRSMWTQGKISSETLKRGTDGTKVVGQARDMGLGVSGDIDTKAKMVADHKAGRGGASQEQIQEWDRTGWASAPAALKQQLSQFDETKRMGVMSTRDAGHVAGMDKSTKWDYLAQTANPGSQGYRDQIVKNVDEILRNGGVGLDAASQKAIYEAVARPGATGEAQIATSTKGVTQTVRFDRAEMDQLARHFQTNAAGEHEFRINVPTQRSVLVDATGEPIQPTPNP